MIYFAALISQNCDMYLNRIKWLLVTFVIEIPNYIERYKNDMVLSSNRFKHYKNHFTVIIVCCTKGTKLLNIFICSLFLWAATVDDLLQCKIFQPIHLTLLLTCGKHMDFGFFIYVLYYEKHITIISKALWWQSNHICIYVAPFPWWSSDIIHCIIIVWKMVKHYSREVNQQSINQI